ncbi:phospholipid-binding protein MlaC [Uliginosibacterium sp. sgz301328]|uniref:MlaC/ttg2D family ABC transporter substrate-binding protein n=1 Tax=Uliginosibacterium sp. sgz301328 TaxID=3243764 RepID=UPI00359DFB69
MFRFLRYAALALAVVAAPAFAQEAPDALIKRVTGEVIDIIKNDKAIQSGDTRRAVELIEQKVLPNFDFQRMTALAAGREWRNATPDQKTQLAREFQTLLVRSYSNALTQYKNQTIDFKPLRMQASDTEVTVRTEVRQPGAKPIGIDYDLEKIDGGWKVFDVIVAEVSLVTNYRDTFAQEIKAGGIDGLIKSLRTKNEQLAAKQGDAGKK